MALREELVRELEQFLEGGKVHCFVKHRRPVEAGGCDRVRAYRQTNCRLNRTTGTPNSSVFF